MNRPEGEETPRKHLSAFKRAMNVGKGDEDREHISKRTISTPLTKHIGDSESIRSAIVGTSPLRH